VHRVITGLSAQCNYYIEINEGDKNLLRLTSPEISYPSQLDNVQTTFIKVIILT